MRSIVIVLTSKSGVVTRQSLGKPDGRPIKLSVPADTRLDVQVQQAPAHVKQALQAQGGGKPDVQLKQVGQNLVIEAEGEALVEVTDFYATPYASVGDVVWSYAEPELDAKDASVEGRAATDGVSSNASVASQGVLPSWATWGAAFGALAAGGGGGGGTVSPTVHSMVSGTITGGPVLANSGLTVILRKADGSYVNGTVAASTAKVEADGKFSLDVGSYSGVLIAQVIDTTPGGADYKDEATGQDKALTANYMAVAAVNGGGVTLNINPLTTIAAQKTGVRVSSDGAVVVSQPLSVAGVSAANSGVAKAFGLSGDLSSLTPDATNDATPGSNDIGKVLAALSGLDAINDGNAQASIDQLAAQITIGSNASDVQVNPGLYAAVVRGAEKAQEGNPSSNSGLKTELARPIATAQSQVTIKVEIGKIPNGSNPDYVRGFCVKAGDIVSVRVSGVALSDVSAKFDLSTNVDGLDSYTAKAGVFDGSETITVDASRSGVAAPTVTTKIDSTAPVLGDADISLIGSAHGRNGVYIAGDVLTAVYDPVRNADVSSVKVDFSQFGGGVGVAATLMTSGDNSGKWVVSYTLGSGVEGVNKAMAVTVKDVAGNETRLTDGTSVRVDSKAPSITSGYEVAENTSQDATPKRIALVADEVVAWSGLEGMDAQYFTLTSSGQLQFKAATNYESAKKSFSVRVTATDAAGNASARDLSINLTDVNEAPEVVAPQAISLTDTPALDSFANQTGQLSASDAEGNRLSYGISAGTTGISEVVEGLTYDVKKVGSYGTLYLRSSTGEYVFKPNANAINAQSANTAEDFTVTVSDGSLSSNTVLRVNLTGVNDLPVLAEGSTLTYQENAAAMAVNTKLLVSDVDSPTLSSATVSITGNFASVQDVLSFAYVSSTMGNITGSYAPTTGVLRLSSPGGTATLAQWQAALRAVQYSNSSENPNKAARTVSYVVNDGTANSMAVTSLVNVGNSAPTAVALSNAVSGISNNTSTAYRIKVADVVVTDDGLGVNTLHLSGEDASSFEIDGNALYLRAGITLDPNKASYAVTIEASDSTCVGSNAVTTGYVLSVTNAKLAFANQQQNLLAGPSTNTRTHVAYLDAIEKNFALGSLELIGPDKDFFEIDNHALYLKSGVSLLARTYAVQITTTDALVKQKSIVASFYLNSVGDNDFQQIEAHRAEFLSKNTWATSFHEPDDVSGDVSTTCFLSEKQTIEGEINSSGDTDWYRIHLTAGAKYVFSIVGTGAISQELKDPAIRIYDSNGTQVNWDADSYDYLNPWVGGMCGAKAVYTAPSRDGDYYLEACSIGGHQGNYGLTYSKTEASIKPSFNNAMTAGMLTESLAGSWSHEITVGFRRTWNHAYAVSDTNGNNDFFRITAHQQPAIKEIVQRWADLIGVSIRWVDDDAGYTDNAQILFSNYYSSTDNTGAFAYLPINSGDEAGDVWLNTKYVKTRGIQPGDYSFFAIMHEMGHALGLLHPGAYNAGPNVSITYENNAEFLQDSQKNTIMSYFYPEDEGGALYGHTASIYNPIHIFPATPMPADVLAIQSLYGANTATRAADTVYMVNDQTQFCIWDAGGVDTIDISSFRLSESYIMFNQVNLNHGSFSRVGPCVRNADGTFDNNVNNLSIAENTWIENVIASVGDDVLMGNEKDNQFTLVGGNDIVYGAAGVDRVILNGVKAQYAVKEIVGGWEVFDISNNWTDELFDVEELIFSDVRIDLDPFQAFDVTNLVNIDLSYQSVQANSNLVLNKNISMVFGNGGHYELLNNLDASFFHIDTNSGDLTLAAPSAVVQNHTYHVNVVATDGVYYSNAQAFAIYFV